MLFSYSKLLRYYSTVCTTIPATTCKQRLTSHVAPTRTSTTGIEPTWIDRGACLRWARVLPLLYTLLLLGLCRCCCCYEYAEHLSGLIFMAPKKCRYVRHSIRFCIQQQQYVVDCCRVRYDQRMTHTSWYQCRTRFPPTVRTYVQVQVAGWHKTPSDPSKLIFTSLSWCFDRARYRVCSVPLWSIYVRSITLLS